MNHAVKSISPKLTDTWLVANDKPLGAGCCHFELLLT